MMLHPFYPHPRSKRDEGLPYTYEARVDFLEGRGREPLHDLFFSDTLCGLIECLDGQGVQGEYVELFGLYRGWVVRLDLDLLTHADGTWLARPELCRVLEEHYEQTHLECYRGHVEAGHCAFEDRSREGVGPVW